MLKEDRKKIGIILIVVGIPLLLLFNTFNMHWIVLYYTPKRTRFEK
jgi:hypothetical protein